MRYTQLLTLAVAACLAAACAAGPGAPSQSTSAAAPTTPAVTAGQTEADATRAAQEQGSSMSSSDQQQTAGNTPAARPTPADATPNLDPAGTGSPDAAAPTSSSAAPASWLLYTDTTFAFSLRYPDTYVRLEEPAAFNSIAPSLVQRVRLQDKALAAAPTAQFEPPKFSVEVFENKAGGSLEEWLDANGIPGATRARATIGDRRGYKLTLSTMQAPNEFYYLDQGSYVYRLIGLGPEAETILASFRLTP